MFYVHIYIYIYIIYALGQVFEEITRNIQTKFGPNAYALAIALTLDETTQGKIGSRNQCPVSFLILNDRNAKYQLMGYAPIHSPYSINEYHEMHCFSTNRNPMDTSIFVYIIRCQIY